MPTQYRTLVRKTSVYLSDEEISLLSRLAHQEGLPQAEIIRRAIRSYQPERRGDRHFRMDGAGKGQGGTIADVSKAELLDGFGS